MRILFVLASLHYLNLIFYRTTHIHFHRLRNFTVTDFGLPIWIYSGYRREGSRNPWGGEEYGVLGKPN